MFILQRMYVTRVTRITCDALVHYVTAGILSMDGMFSSSRAEEQLRCDFCIDVRVSPVEVAEKLGVPLSATSIRIRGIK